MERLMDYLVGLLGKQEAYKLCDALHMGRPILVSGPQISGKTTLVRVLRAMGYKAEEVFDPMEWPWHDDAYQVQTTTYLPRSKREPNKAEALLASIGVSEAQ